MKVVATYRNDDTLFGLVSAMESMEMQVVLWDRTKKPTFDMFDEVRPDLFICGAEDIDESTVAALSEFEDTKVVLFGMGVPSDIKPTLVVYPNVLTPEQIARINIGKHPYTTIPTAANLSRLGGGVFEKKHRSDIFYLSDAMVPPEQILSYLAPILPGHRVKIVGPAVVPCPEYAGQATLSTINNCLHSTTVGLDFGNRHYLDYAINKVFCICSEKNDLFPSATPETIKHEVEKYLEADKLRKKVIRTAYAEVASSHTYFHRVADLFEKIGEPGLAQHAYKTMEVILND